MLDHRDLTATVLRASAVALAYGNGPVVVAGLDFAVGPGRRVGVLGPNGAGKTTLFRALWGELEPVAGRLERPARIGVVPQTERSRLDYPVSALDVALLGTLASLSWWRRPGRVERERALDALAAVGLEERANATFGRLSGGQRQRVLIARALVQDAPLLLLDEPYVGLDAAARDQLDGLLEALAGAGRTLLIASHDRVQARDWDHALVLEDGSAAFGAPEDVL